MKSPSSAFNTKLLKIAGEKPLILAKIYYGTGVNDFFLCSTERVKIGSDVYNPYVKEFGDIEFNIGREGSIASVNTAEVTLIRNATTDNLLIPTAKNKKVHLWDWFEGLTSFSDALPIGTFVIGLISNVSQSTFTVHMVSDETKFEKEIPENILNKTDYPNMNEDYIDQVWPLVLGDMASPGYGDFTSQYLDGYKVNLAPCFCIDKSLYKFLAYRHGSISPLIMSSRAFKLELGQKIYTELYTSWGDPFPGPCWSGVSGNYFKIVDVNDFDLTSHGNERRVRILTTQEGTSNNVDDWQNACDRDLDSVAHLDATDNILHVKCENIKGIGEYIPPGWAATRSMYRVKCAMSIKAISGTVSMQLFINGTPHPSDSFNTVGYKEKTNWNSVNDILEANKYSIKITLTGGTSAEIDGVHLIVCYWDNMEINVPPDRRYIKAKKRRTEGSIATDYPIDVPEFKGGQIFAEIEGPADQSGQGWDFRHPLAHLYFLLVKMGGFLSSDLNLINWDSIHGEMGAGWATHIAIIQKRKLIDWCDQLLRECGLKMWRDSNNLIRIFMINKASASPDMTFSNQSADVYLMKDCKWGYVENFYNKFDLKYQWDHGKGEYQSFYLKDKNNDADLEDSYENFSNVEMPYPYPEFDWIREFSVMDLIYVKLKKAYKDLPIETEFDSGLICTLLELGDTIQSDHTAQNWNMGDKNFQVLGISRNNNRFHIKAIEVIP